MADPHLHFTLPSHAGPFLFSRELRAHPRQLSFLLLRPNSDPERIITHVIYTLRIRINQGLRVRRVGPQSR